MKERRLRVALDFPLFLTVAHGRARGCDLSLSPPARPRQQRQSVVASGKNSNGGSTIFLPRRPPCGSHGAPAAVTRTVSATKLPPFSRLLPFLL
nr:hypothetical protein Itr_chr14CG09160 [Ipomoea trifida]